MVSCWTRCQDVKEQLLYALKSAQVEERHKREV